MSTNYYAKNQFTGTDEGLHIGKRSIGHVFIFRGYPDHGLVTSEDWARYLNEPDVTIVTESGVPVPVEDWWLDVVIWSQQRATVPVSHRYRRDSEGYYFLDQEFC